MSVNVGGYKRCMIGRRPRLCKKCGKPLEGHLTRNIELVDGKIVRVYYRHLKEEYDG